MSSTVLHSGPSAATAVALALLLSGCRGSDFEVAPAKGKVVSAGKPISGGTVIFTPTGGADPSAPGKPAIGTVGADGSFVLTTYENGDGAIVGKHEVSYSPPEDAQAEEDEEPNGEEDTRTRAPAAKAATRYRLAEALSVDVSADGPNEFDIEVVPAREGSTEQ